MKFTPRQLEAQKVLAGAATHCLLRGGSRSGKTYLLVRNVVLRGLKAPNSRHCILRFRFNHIKSAIIFDTFPKVMRECFPDTPFVLNKSDWFATLPNGSEIWFGGLDDKERTEKILGNEYVTIYLNECSQISWQARNTVMTRLAQKVQTNIGGREPKDLKPRMYYDCNPPNKGHWLYKVFIKKVDPESKEELRAEDYVEVKMNPQDNVENLTDNYLGTLQSLSKRMQRRFLEGEFADDNQNALFSEEDIDKWRHLTGDLPDFIRIVVAVDPSGSGDVDNAANDAIGIVAAALGTDGNAYVLEDNTVKAGPATWGRVAVNTYERLEADVVVGEQNYGGAMVKHVIQTARPRTPYQAVTATRGKVVRAEPISALYEQGKVRHVGFHRELEEELAGFSTAGYIGERSPNRADAAIWALSALFPGIVQTKRKQESATPIPILNYFGRRK